MSGVKHFYKLALGNGKIIYCWHDVWSGDISMKTQFWDLFDLCQQQNCTIAQVWDDQILKLAFRRCVDISFFGEMELPLEYPS